MHWGGGLKPYFLHAVDCEDFGMATIEGVKEDGAGSGGRGATIYIRNGQHPTVSGVGSAEIGKKLVVRE